MEGGTLPDVQSATVFGRPQRPIFPGGEGGPEDKRVALVENMECVLDEDWHEVLKKWAEQVIPLERLEQWGPMDTSTNDLGDLSRQLSTPGLYSRRPMLRHLDDSALPLVEPGGPLDACGLWPKMQQVQYKAIGLGDYLVSPHVDSEGTISIHVRSPRSVHGIAHPMRPDEFQELWDLQLHSFDIPGYTAPKEAWVWVKYRIDDSAPGKADRTYYKAILATSLSEAGEALKSGADVSNLVLQTSENPSGDFKGERYPFQVDGRNVIPWVHYRSVDGGGLWNHLARRGAYHGTLNAALLSTYANQAARDATGTAVLIAGLVIPTEARSGVGEAQQTTTVYLTPGGIIQAKFDPESQGQQPFVKELGSGANIVELADYQARYSSRILTRFGLNPSDVTRQAANPASAASLVVSDRGRRDYSRQMEPLFRRADLQLIAMIAAFSNQHASTNYPERGYSIEYHQIPDSPTEEREKRDRWTWELERGQLSPVGLYQRLHPGTPEVDAVKALALVEAQKRMVAIEVDRQLAQLSAPPEPEPPPPEPPEGDDALPPVIDDEQAA